MTIPQNVKDRIQTLSDRRLEVWQKMASTWLPGSTAPINADAFLSLIAEVRRCRAHLMSQEAEIARLNDAVDRLQQLWSENAPAVEYKRRALLAESRLAAADALLREIYAGDDLEQPARRNEALDRIQSHLQGAGDEA